MSKRPATEQPYDINYFRKLEEQAKSKDPAFRAELDSEFSRAHVHTPPSDEAVGLGRRGFMTMMGAALALAGAEGCRRPIENIIPYRKVPEEVIPGIPSHFATVYDRRGEALGLLVESHEGRPTKIEGNPDHPSSMGGADLLAQASVLDLYDMDRTRVPVKGGAESSFVAFDGEMQKLLGDMEGNGGERLRVLMQPITSPTLLRLRQAVKRRFPKATFHTWTAATTSNVREGAKIAFGQYAQPVYGYDKAQVILSLDCDFLQTEPGNVRANKLFAQGRRLRSPNQQRAMSRLYVVEPAWTTTGTTADHRLRLPAGDVEKYLLALIGQVLAQLPSSAAALGDFADAAKAAGNLPGVPQKWLVAVAKDLINAGNDSGRKLSSLVVAGSRQPAHVHALVFALNQALGNLGRTLDFVAPADAQEQDNVADIKALAQAMAGKQVDALFVVGGNPVYDAPADVGFGAALANVKTTVHLSMFFDETGAKCTWHLPRTHELEAWGDQQSLDGSLSVQQPLIAPLYGGRSDVDLLGMLANAAEKTGYDAVRATWVGLDGLLLRAAGWSACQPAPGGLTCSDTTGSPGKPVASRTLEASWAKLLRDGVLVDPGARADTSTGRPMTPTWPAKSARVLGNIGFKSQDIKAALAARTLAASPTADALEVTFAPCPKMMDGRHANNSWLLELPDPMTKIVWDNAAIVSPATAKAKGLSNGDLVTLSVGGQAIDVGVWVLKGQADNTVALTLGWGRAPRTPDGKSPSLRLAEGRGFNVYPIRSTKALHFAPGGTVSAKGKYDFGQTQTYDYQFTDDRRNTPREEDPRPLVRETTYRAYQDVDSTTDGRDFAQKQSPPPRKLPLWHEQGYGDGYQWGMTIDLTACTGCNACVIACQAENNVPVVGKIEAARGREMYWIRLDRYFVPWTPHAADGQTASDDDPLVAHQPLPCQQCEDAPCENVCPVAATTHSPEGLNDMAYNRCIGTRYCANNCPYKVRRFNYLNWHNDAVWKEEGDIPETYKMQMNPNVTVRFRGVMEKCTYCVQRIQMAKIKVKREVSSDPKRVLRDGEFTTACAQTCPADAIVFGNLNDPSSEVTKLTALDRQYKLLDEIGTKPRTTYLGKVRNPNREMA
jgi:molybdopterin-containing oxidoreductase family iron-sulfur binding subunit